MTQLTTTPINRFTPCFFGTILIFIGLTVFLWGPQNLNFASIDRFTGPAAIVFAALGLAGFILIAATLLYSRLQLHKELTSAAEVKG
jgi:hypothetical protein